MLFLEAVPVQVLHCHLLSREGSAPTRRQKESLPSNVARPEEWGAAWNAALPTPTPRRHLFSHLTLQSTGFFTAPCDVQPETWPLFGGISYFIVGA